MVRLYICAPEAVDPVDGRSASAVPATPTRSGDGRERILDVLRAGGLRFRDGGRWRPALV
ncbi:hypothetical protein ACFY2R_20245 [Micromonospora olivasterospora]|uniref:Uncharacterized protein n=1 Tax=Micromonospora olivasterospora TaxID=1880 RepID=A0A562I7V2_MICOL|nr:hypothetical protein [Micromonospora olivasterospora]TWH67081.1 hypothetical protein JD77_02050 [Micromonospora olivasterospora]